MVALDVYALAELAHGLFGNLSVHLGQVGARVLEFRVEQFLDEFAVVRKQQGAFAVVVEPACRIHSRREGERVECRVSRFGRELAQYAEGLVEEDDGRHGG